MAQFDLSSRKLSQAEREDLRSACEISCFVQGLVLSYALEVKGSGLVLVLSPQSSGPSRSSFDRCLHLAGLAVCSADRRGRIASRGTRGAECKLDDVQ